MNVVAKPPSSRYTAVVNALEEALADARAGRVRSFALAVVGDDTYTTWAVESKFDRPFLYMQMDRMKERVFVSHFGRDRND